MTPALIEKLKKLAEQGCWDDGFTVESTIDDYAGGNVDDAYEGGTRSGETLLAREILDELEIPYKARDD